jgi:hypothetical protein
LHRFEVFRVSAQQPYRPIEIKLGATYAKDWAAGLRKWQGLAKTESLQPAIVYGGDLSFEREDLKVWGWKDVAKSVDRAARA